MSSGVHTRYVFDEYNCPTMDLVEEGVSFSVLWLLLSLTTKVVVGIVILGFSLKYYLHCTKGICPTQARMDGKVVIITGGNAGIGKETAKELARRGARVILACRNAIKAAEAADEIFSETGQKVKVKKLDLTSFASVRKFAEDILETEERVDVLINNAGMMHDLGAVQVTEDGYEACFQTNYLGHALLTFLLLGVLKKSSPSRVINLTSFMHHFGNADDLEGLARGKPGRINSTLAYSHSKFAIVVFTRTLADKLRWRGVTVNAVHPGIVTTNIGKDGSGLLSSTAAFIVNLFGKTAQEGADTCVHAAVDPSMAERTGKYLVDCREDWVSRRALNREKALVTFETTLRLIGLEPSEIDKALG